MLHCFSADLLLRCHCRFHYQHCRWLALNPLFFTLQPLLPKESLNEHPNSPHWKRAARSISSLSTKSCGFFLRICASRQKKVAKMSAWSDKLLPGVLELPLQVIKVTEHTSLSRDFIRGNCDPSLPYNIRNCKGME